MEKLQQLQEQLQVVQGESPTGFAHAVSRKHKIEALEREIAYYEEGECRSIYTIQKKLEDIKTMQEEIDSLERLLSIKKADLKEYVFGSSTISL